MSRESSSYTLEKVCTEVMNEISSELESGRVAALEQVQTMLRETKGEITKTIEAGERQAESLRRQIIGSAELEARNKLLRTLEDASNQVFQEALRSISEKSSAYEKSLARLIEEGVGLIGKGAVVSCNTKDTNLAGSILGELNRRQHADLKLDEKSIETVGGVMLTSKDATIRFDNTFEARLERMKPQLRRDASRVLGSTQ